MDTKIYIEMSKRADNLVKNYRNDLLVHDKNEIERLKDSTPFLYFARENGTHIYPFLSSDELPLDGQIVPYLFGTANREHIINGIVSCVDYHDKSHEILLVLYFDGLIFHEIDTKKACFIAQEYVSNMLSSWKKGE